MGTVGKGVMPAVMTMWKADESYNEKETLRYVQWVLDKGAHSISCVGSTGDNISMSTREQKYIMESIIKSVDHKVPVYGEDHRAEPVRAEVRGRRGPGHHALLSAAAQTGGGEPLQEAEGSH